MMYPQALQCYSAQFEQLFTLYPVTKDTDCGLDSLFTGVEVDAHWRRSGTVQH